ncbi:AEC family transporter [Conservatibacter flavescens]|uniref:Autotransporter n=1 Tax=Conservatibacter flavescens TaxID=28161 RepID=A0A2M8S5Y4_9PAST|nr:AEC family transporter [Conservatibacter flavescens]PJG86528.1 autotransporter [Conservatibacter flavescens]
MELALLLAIKITELALIMFAGFAIVKSKLLDSKDSYPLSVIGLYIISPCVIINAFQVDYTPEVSQGLLFSFALAIILHIVLIILVKLLSIPLKLDSLEQATSIYSNSGNLIIPLVTALFGPEWVIYSCGFMAVQIFLFWSHCRILLCGKAELSFKKIISNINIISIIVGLILFVFQIKLPSLITGTFSAIGIMIGPNAMLIAGMLLASIPLRTLFSSKRIYLVSFLRLIFIPLCILVIMKAIPANKWLPNGDIIMMISFLAVTSPAASTVTQMALLFKKDANKASGIYGVTTLLCVMTMPLIIAIYQW